MEALPVVVCFDVGEPFGPQEGHRWPWSEVDEFFIDRGEEGLGDGVVVADPGFTDRGPDLVVGAERAELIAGVLPGLPRSEWKITPGGGVRFFRTDVPDDHGWFGGAG